MRWVHFCRLEKEVHRAFLDKIVCVFKGNFSVVVVVVVGGGWLEANARGSEVLIAWMKMNFPVLLLASGEYLLKRVILGFMYLLFDHKELSLKV